jgi:hypothetical protein
MTLSLGPCCFCETYTGVTVIVMLNRRAPIAGHGWGCAVCDLPSDGAVAVFCESCYGYPGSDGRIPYSELSPEHFDHRDVEHEGAWG